MKHIVKLENFEGPLDLLLHLIRSNEMDIYNIPIASVTDQYLATLKMMKDLNIAIAGEFIYMAATLIYIKSRMLLPVEELIPDDEEDPRMPLIEMLLEFQTFSRVARHLAKNSISSTSSFPVGLSADFPDRGFQKMNVFHLSQTFMEVMQGAKQKFHEVYTENYSVGDKIEEIKKLLVPGKKMKFSALFKHTSRMEGIVTFLAILELVKEQALDLFQQDMLGLIEIMAVKNA